MKAQSESKTLLQYLTQKVAHLGISELRNTYETLMKNSSN